MKIYVASKFNERLKVRWLMDKLEDMGHEITFDWTTEHYQHKEETREDAKECMNGVLLSDAYVGMFLEDYHYKGALVELGIALTIDIPVYVIGHAMDSCIFTKLTHKFETETEFLSFIRGIDKSRRVG